MAFVCFFEEALCSCEEYKTLGETRRGRWILAEAARVRVALDDARDGRLPPRRVNQLIGVRETVGLQWPAPDDSVRS